MMTRMFQGQISETVEVYIGNMVVKSKIEVEHVLNLVEVIKILRQHKLRLNVDKCAFGMGSRKFLSYMITTWGMEANHDQIKAIQKLKPPINPKEVQKLMGMVAALNRFVSRSTTGVDLSFSY